MNRTGILILVIGILLSVAVTVLSRGHFVLIGLPLLFAAPLAGMFGRKRRL